MKCSSICKRLFSLANCWAMTSCIVPKSCKPYSNHNTLKQMLNVVDLFWIVLQSKL